MTQLLPSKASVASFTLSAWATISAVAAQNQGSTATHQGVLYPEPVQRVEAPAVAPPPRVVGQDATLPDHKRGLPVVPVGTGNLPQPNDPQSGPPGAVGPAAPCDLRFFENSVVKPSGASTSQVGEPSVAQARDTVLQTGNWYAARSIDSGNTWTYISPSTTFAATDGGFCCDQRAIYIPSADITVWLLQYSYSATTQKGGQRIAVANGRDELRADTNGTWHSYYLDPQDFGRPLGEWLDFPDISYSNGFLYAASNIFNAASSYTDSVVWRMPLNELAAGGTVSFSYSRSSTGLGGGASYRLTQNAGSTMYFAEHRTTTSTRAYRWPDASGTISWTDITVPDWSSTTGYVASAPNGINWAGRADSRITGAYYSAALNEYGFMWHCAPRSGRAQVYVRTIRISAATNALISTQDTWSSTFQFMYPAACVNFAGDIGVTTSIADSTSLHPTNCYFIVDSCIANFSGQSVSWFTGNNSPTTANRWGDYFSLQRHPNNTNTFIATGMTCRDGGTNADVEPHFVWFGREQNQPTFVNLAVTSTPVSGPTITIDVTDRNNLRNGVTPFNRVYAPRQGYTLTAPATYTQLLTYVFDRWSLNGGLQPVGERVLEVSDIGSVDDTAEAQYKIRRTLQIRSSNPTSGIAITVSAPDTNGNQNGTTPVDRFYKDGTTVTLTAPALNGINPFKQWIVTGVAQPLGQLSVNVLVNGTETATAVYYTRTVGTFTSFCSGCPGTGGNVPAHSGVGTPEIAGFANWRVSNARALSGGVLYVGASRTTYNGFPLPLALNIVNMGSCLLCVSIDVSINFATNSLGNASINVPIPDSTALISSRLFSQAAILDVGAPHSTPVVHSNALQTFIGGNQ